MKDLFKDVLKPDPALSIGMTAWNDFHFVSLMIETAKGVYKVTDLEGLKKHDIQKVEAELVPLVAGACILPCDEVVIFTDPVIHSLLEPKLAELKESLVGKVKLRFAVSHNVMIRNTIFVVTNSDTSNTYPSFYPVRHNLLGTLMIDPESFPQATPLAVPESFKL